MKKIEYICNVCRFTIEGYKGYGMLWHGTYRKEDLKLVRLIESEHHICSNCFEKIKGVNPPTQ